MKKNVWILNHYATLMYKDQAGRHYWFAENLIKNGYDAHVFCASTIHNSEENIDVENRKYTTKYSNQIPFIFVKTPAYGTSRKKRILNMLAFYKNVLSVAIDYAEKHGKPDVILASSVHPLTLVAGIQIAKKFGVPCICEVRDLWPESIVAYGKLSKKHPLIKILYKGEKWIYKKADSVIMTWEGGKDYIIDQGWERQVDLKKFQHISNGVIIDDFDKNSVENVLIDTELNNGKYKNIVYAGSIREVNNIGMLLDAAKIIQSKGIEDIRFLIYGSGNETEMLKQRCKTENIANVIFKGRVEKKYIPSILKKSYANILHNSSTSLDKYGQSQNKFFEYLAAGKPIIQTYSTGYSICENANCGVSAAEQTPEEIAEAISIMINKENVNKEMGINARRVAYNHDFNLLTRKLIKIIENV